MTNTVSRARSFLGGEAFTFAEADGLWRELRKRDELSLARSVLARLRSPKTLLDGLPTDRELREELCRQQALLTSKDPELNSADRHDQALTVLADMFDLDDRALDGNPETLGIAAGIHKRRWNDLGQLKDLIRAANLYERGARAALGEDAYAHINAAFLDDLLANAGEEAASRRARAEQMRQRIVADLPATGSWWNTATRAEALFGLRRYDDATAALGSVAKAHEPWTLETTARQLGTLAHLQEQRPLERPEIRRFFDALLPGAPDAADSVIRGRVGLALSGGGFRASFYHLGVLARLAELDVLRHVDVLSCVSGGSIIGACYWLTIRRRLLDSRPFERGGYVALVRELIDHFTAAVGTNLRGTVQPSLARVAWHTLRGQKGALDPELTARALREHFYRPLMPGSGPLFMHDLPFRPADHDPALTGSPDFHPGKHNWLRGHKVPILVLNATSVNTGHAWQFTPTWMGESPWAIHEAADSVPRLEWSWYEPDAGWTIELGRAVAASACVPFVFEPLELAAAYGSEIQVQLVDGGVHDNQGTVSLLALNCNVLLVSDACGQLLFEAKPQPGQKGLVSYAMRSMSTLMERVRWANFGDLASRRRSGLLRGLMFLHLKAGLDADPVRLAFSQAAYELERSPLSPFGVRKDFQQALGELRTDLDAFTPHESLALMACGYQMASRAYQRDVAALPGFPASSGAAGDWPFAEMLGEITSTAAQTRAREALLIELRRGSNLSI